MKKKILFLLISLMLLLIFACKKTKDENNKSEIKNYDILFSKSDDSNKSLSEKIDSLKTMPSLDDMLYSNFGMTTYVFGKYEQDNDLTNGPEDLEWYLVEQDEEDKSKFLFVTKNVIDCLPYDNDESIVHYRDSNIRKWLNQDFYEDTFNDYEKTLICRTLNNEYERIVKDDIVRDSDNTFKYYDNIFLPSKKLFTIFGKDNNDCYPTKYAIAKGAVDIDSDMMIDATETMRKYKDFSIYDGMTQYYMRIKQFGNNKNNSIYTPVNLKDEYMMFDKQGIRPCMWIKVDDDLFERIKNSINVPTIYEHMRVYDNSITLGKDNSNWILCRIEDNKALLMRENEVFKSEFDIGKSRDYSESSLREKLAQYYETNFSDDEKNKILITHNECEYFSQIGGGMGKCECDDYVFIPSHNGTLVYDYDDRYYNYKNKFDEYYKNLLIDELIENGEYEDDGDYYEKIKNEQENGIWYMNAYSNTYDIAEYALAYSCRVIPYIWISLE